jgi:carboxypeptidase family protein
MFRIRPSTVIQLLTATLLVLLCAAFGFGQVTNTGSIAGKVTDQNGEVVPNATVMVKNTATGFVRTATTSDSGTFSVPQLSTGTYTVSIEAPRGFKKSEVTSVKVDVGTPATVNVILEVGAAQETVTIVGGGEVLQTQTANVGNTITGRQIIELPFTSRDSLDLVLMLPGTATPARPRSSTVNGLPKGALTITLDGVPDQDEGSKSGDGFFTYVRPRIDAIEEVSLSSAVPGAESSGDGAVQIKFSTKGGTRDFHGSGYWYHRNTALNANYYFNNISGQPRQLMLLNQPGGRIGGPILIPGLIKSRERAFFFVNYEEFRLPAATSRQRNILTTDAARGIFKYGTSSSKDLLALAGATDCNPTTAGLQPCTATIDPTIASLLTSIRASTSSGGITPLNANQERFTFNSPSSSVRKFTTVRLDFNLSKKHHLEEIWNYNIFVGFPDTLNSADNAFPGLTAGVGGQNSLRWSNAIALRSTFKTNLVNEARFGMGGGGAVLFRPEVTPADYGYLGGFAPSFTVFAPGSNSTTSPFATNSGSRASNPSRVFLDNLSYVKGNHTLNFGTEIGQYNTWNFNINRFVPSITFGLNANDPAQVAGMFATANFPGASSTDITNAQNLYALLTGRVTTITANAYTDENTGKYSYLGSFVERIRQHTMGFYVQDAWRFRPNLTINAGLRWEVQFPFTSRNNNYTQSSYAGLFGVSGEGNIFKPGTLTGSVTQFTPFPPGTHAYNTDWNNLGPSIGFAWSPKTTGGFLRRVMGEPGRTVLRAGYSIAFVREGSDVMSSVIGGNPGGAFTATRSIALGNLTAGTLYRNRGDLGPPVIPGAPVYPLTPTSNPAYSPSNSVNAFFPDLKTGYVQSWSAGIQRELTKDTVLEMRYVANRGVHLWRQLNLNETNIIENGFINEYKLAQANLQANIAAGRGATFRYFGTGTGTSPLPTVLAYFRGNVDPNIAANYTGSFIGPSGASINVGNLFTSTTFVNPLAPNNANARTFAANLYSDADRRALAIARGLAPNFFTVNPNLQGGAFLVDNGGHTYYDALQIELRRRLARGLLLQGSYTFSKALSNMFASSSVVSFQPSTLRNQTLDKVASPFDLRHAFKTSWIYELPVGKGRWLAGDANGTLDRLVGGWGIHGQARVQSGSTFNLGNVQLVGMTSKELQNSIKIRKDPTGVVFFLPDDIILNTQRAFNVTSTGFGSAGAPTGRYIAPANSNGCIQTYVGQCGFANLVLYGPPLTRFDISLVKKTKLTETSNFELRAEFLNAFNNINFKVGSQSAEVTGITNFSGSTFGQTANAYQDLSTTNDPGGRMIQIVVRITF